MSDLCASPFCQDVALPGRDFCSGCWEEEMRGREVTRRAAEELTAEHERQVAEQDGAVAA